MEKKSFILGFILAIVAFGLIALASAEDWNLNNPVVVQNQNVTGKQNLTFLPENAIVIIGAGGNVTSDAVNLAYYTANQTLVVKLIKVQNISDSDNSAYYIDPANTGTSGVFAGNISLQGRQNFPGGVAVTGSTDMSMQGGAGVFVVYDGGAVDIFGYNYTSVSPVDIKSSQGRWGIGNVAFPSGGGTPVLVMAQAGSAPTGLGSNTAGIYVLDVSGTAELFTIDEGGTSTQQTSHPSDFLNTLPNDENHTFPWVYTASNPYLGKKVIVDEEAAFRALEALTGKRFVYVENITKTSWADTENWRESEENNRSRNSAIEAWLRNASELEVLPSLAFEMVWDNKTVTTGRIVRNTTEYSFDENGTVMDSLVPVFETKTISRQKKQLKDGIQFNKAIGKFYRKPTRAEAEVAVGESYPHYIKQAPPKWMQDRGAN